MTRLSFRFAKRKSTAWCRWALRFVCCILAAAVSVDIPAEERGTGAVSLSDRERQAALLAVSGLTNRQIAERLEIAVRTVEFHRAGSMRKLGCHSAAELKAKLALVPEAREAFE